MASGATFTSTWARCKEHGTLLEPNETMCQKCKIIQRNMALTPPFDVYCIEDGYNLVEKGNTYTVYWVVYDGREARDIQISGYALKNEDGSVADEVLAADKFIPCQYLTKDNKDSWLESHE